MAGPADWLAPVIQTLGLVVAVPANRRADSVGDSNRRMTAPLRVATLASAKNVRVGRVDVARKHARSQNVKTVTAFFSGNSTGKKPCKLFHANLSFVLSADYSIELNNRRDVSGHANYPLTEWLGGNWRVSG